MHLFRLIRMRMNLFKTIKCIGTIHSCGTGNIQLFKTYEIEMIDDKYLNLVIVYLNTFSLLVAIQKSYLF